jgi:hypothetical protein
MLSAGASGTYYFHYIASGRPAGFLPIDENDHVKYYPPQYLATQLITKEWVESVDSVHKLFRAAGDVRDKDGNMLVTAYPVERPDGQWSVMLINKDQDNAHSVQVSFAGTDAGHDRFFTGAVDRIVFGAAEYQWHPDPATPDDKPMVTGDDGGGRRPALRGHPDPDGPPTKSTVASTGPDTLYELPKASVVVLRGKLADR